MKAHPIKYYNETGDYFMTETTECTKCGEPIKLGYLGIGWNCRTLLRATTENTHKAAEKINGKYYCGLCKMQKES